MKFNEFYIENSEGKSNCVIRSFCKLFNKEYDQVYNELCNIQKELNCSSYNDIEVFETYMNRNGIDKIEYGSDIKIKDLSLGSGSYIVFCYDKKDFYHMVTIIDNVLFDKDNRSLELYTISIYKQKTLTK
jgi:hypothetical protein